MANTIKDDVRVAIERSQTARDKFTTKMYEMSEHLGYTDPGDKNVNEKQVFGEPASEAEIDKLEELLILVLPPSYKAFLLLSDGWKVIDGSQNFFSIKELVEWRKRKDPSGWMAIAKQAGDEFVDSCVVVGASDDSPDKYLLNPDVVNEQSEWQFIEYSKDGYVSYESFFSYLVATKEQFSESAKDMDLAEYFDPFEE